MTSEADRRHLLHLARLALASYVDGTPMPAPDLTGALACRAGAFVTLHAGAALRGCIGHLEADEPLGVAVARSAVAAGSSDPRFPVVTAAELPRLRIEISILGPLVPLSTLDAIQIGSDGLLVERGWHRGLLLPQVATEQQWDRETFVAETCRKAGLPGDAWKKGATIWKFSAEVFGET